MTDTQKQQENQTAYAPYNGDASFMRQRIDPSQILSNIEVFLKGKQIIQTFNEDTQKFEVIERHISEPLMNDAGIHVFMSKIQLLINSHTVQGFWKDRADYDNFVSMTRKEIANAVYDLAIVANIKDEHNEIITDHIMSIVKPFFTRLYDNTERQSYGTVRITQNESVQQRKGWSI